MGKNLDLTCFNEKSEPLYLQKAMNKMKYKIYDGTKKPRTKMITFFLYSSQEWFHRLKTHIWRLEFGRNSILESGGCQNKKPLELLPLTRALIPILAFWPKTVTTLWPVICTRGIAQILVILPLRPSCGLPNLASWPCKFGCFKIIN